jgi:hypothetical protein
MVSQGSLSSSIVTPMCVFQLLFLFRSQAICLGTEQLLAEFLYLRLSLGQALILFFLGFDLLLQGGSHRQRFSAANLHARWTLYFHNPLFWRVSGTLISRNVMAAGVLDECLALLNHQLKVARSTPYCRENALRVRPLRRNCSTICSRSADTAGRNGFGDFCICMHPAKSIIHARCRCTPVTAYFCSTYASCLER